MATKGLIAFTLILALLCPLPAMAMRLPSLQYGIGGVLYSPDVELWRGHLGVNNSFGSYIEVTRHISLGFEYGLQNYPAWDGDSFNNPLSAVFVVIFGPVAMSGSHKVQLDDGRIVKISEPIIMNSDICIKFIARDESIIKGSYLKLGMGAFNHRTGDEVTYRETHIPEARRVYIKEGGWQKQLISLVIGFGGEQPLNRWLTIWGGATIHQILDDKDTGYNEFGFGDLIVQLGLKISMPEYTEQARN